MSNDGDGRLAADGSWTHHTSSLSADLDSEQCTRAHSPGGEFDLRHRVVQRALAGPLSLAMLGVPTASAELLPVPLSKRGPSSLLRRKPNRRRPPTVVVGTPRGSASLPRSSSVMWPPCVPASDGQDLVPVVVDQDCVQLATAVACQICPPVVWLTTTSPFVSVWRRPIRDGAPRGV